MAKKRAKAKPPAETARESARPGVLVQLFTAVFGPLTRENALGWAKLIALVLVIRWLWFEPFRVPSGSMEPTLYGNEQFFRDDRVAVNKWVYGPRVPFMNRRLFRLHAPRRWDIVVFRAVEQNPRSKHLVKRIVGLPGERIHIANGTVFADGEPLTPPESLRGVLHYTTQFEPSDDDVLQWLIAEAPNGRALLAEEVDPATFQAKKQELIGLMNAGSKPKYGIRTEDEYAVVPEDCYLVLGDNSGHSHDGRYFGWVPNDHIVGPAFCVWWPWGHRQDFTGFSSTWWGGGLLFGLPALLVLYEICASYFARSIRLAAGMAPPGVARPGERLMINRAALGFRLPFMQQRRGGRTLSRGQ
ncbi:MAG: signal peptidase I, partial [Candidatus Hydrogenedentes bacterium]|nr:signal peptidase I [Candidatus Hydrogenedentota bacterium]